MAFLCDPPSNAAKTGGIDAKRRTTREEVAEDSELRELLKKPRRVPIVTSPYVQERDIPPITGSTPMVSLLTMPLPASLPSTTQPITPATAVCQAAPTILGKRRSAATSTITSYVLPIPLVAVPRSFHGKWPKVPFWLVPRPQLFICPFFVGIYDFFYQSR